jgi:hypothetical protein
MAPCWLSFGCDNDVELSTGRRRLRPSIVCSSRGVVSLGQSAADCTANGGKRSLPALDPPAQAHRVKRLEKGLRLKGLRQKGLRQKDGQQQSYRSEHDFKRGSTHSSHLFRNIAYRNESS